MFLSTHKSSQSWSLSPSLINRHSSRKPHHHLSLSADQHKWRSSHFLTSRTRVLMSTKNSKRTGSVLLGVTGSWVTLPASNLVVHLEKQNITEVLKLILEQFEVSLSNIQLLTWQVMNRWVYFGAIFTLRAFALDATEFKSPSLLRVLRVWFSNSSCFFNIKTLVVTSTSHYQSLI